ncbi:NAD(P)-binding domain-containing protein, partial [bacterium]|nr:NAD(P)-binding domain-containing protein [bacterium]
MNAQKILISRIESREAKVAIIGLGYFGLPLAIEFASAGIETTGVDLSEEKVAQINAGESYIADVPSAEVRVLVEAGKLGATTDAAALGEVDCICI